MIETILTFSVDIIGSVDIIQSRLLEDSIRSLLSAFHLCFVLISKNVQAISCFFLFRRRCEVALLRLLLKRLETSVL